MTKISMSSQCSICSKPFDSHNGGTVINNQQTLCPLCESHSQLLEKHESHFKKYFDGSWKTQNDLQENTFEIFINDSWILSSYVTFRSWAGKRKIDGQECFLKTVYLNLNLNRYNA